jgi:hypothetical protein
MTEVNVTERKSPGRVTVSPDVKLLIGRVEAAGMLSIICRALDYLVANKQLLIRRIGTRVLIPSWVRLNKRQKSLIGFSVNPQPARL